jgi:hypothetical protein
MEHSHGRGDDINGAHNTGFHIFPETDYAGRAFYDPAGVIINKKKME